MGNANGVIRLAILGAGKIARDQHAPSLLKAPRFQLKAVVDPVGGLEGFPHFSSLQALLESGLAIDAVAICTPPQVRSDLAKTAIEAGLHVLLEKPPAMTLSEAEILRRAAERAGVALFAAWHSRFAPMVARAKAWLAHRPIRGGRVIWREDAHVWHPGQAWLWQAGGQGVFDPGINALSILTEILPGLLHVKSAAFETPINAQSPTAAHLALGLGEIGLEVDLDFREPGPPTWRIELETDDGVLTLDRGGHVLTLPGQARFEGEGAEYPALYTRFAELVARTEIDFDLAPLRLVADAFLVADHSPTVAFEP